jgi:hypothetical protein
MTQEISHDFAFYLKSKGVYSNFIANAKKKEYPHPFNYFEWKNTVEGYDYWHDIFNGFVDFLLGKYKCEEVING